MILNGKLEDIILIYKFLKCFMNADQELGYIFILQKKERCNINQKTKINFKFRFGTPLIDQNNEPNKLLEILHFRIWVFMYKLGIL